MSFSRFLHERGRRGSSGRETTAVLHVTSTCIQCDHPRTPQTLKKSKFDLVLFQAGVDILNKDSLGYLEISREGIKNRNEIVLELAREKDLPLVVFMGGGYSKPIQHSVDAFVDLFVQCSNYANMIN